MFLMKDRQSLIGYITSVTTWTVQELESYTIEQLAELAEDIAEGYRLLKKGAHTQDG
jgi:hypothetical protein